MKSPKTTRTKVNKVAADVPVLRSRAERLAAGQAMRNSVPRSSHADWTQSAHRRDPIEILEESNHDRLPELVAIRYGRMLRSPVTFLRGSAALMAYDLATTPSMGLRVQACGDCHLLNFGLFATPERNLVFDLNDFDETLPAPWEWDLKRLAVSFAVAGRDSLVGCGFAGSRPAVRARLSGTPAGVLPNESSGSLVHPPRHENSHCDGTRRKGQKDPRAISRQSPPACCQKPLSQDCRRSGWTPPPGRSTAASLSRQ